MSPMTDELRSDDVLVKVVATIIVRVPNRHPDAQATDGLNEMFREAEPQFIVDWGYEVLGDAPGDLGLPARAVVLNLNPDTYEEGDAWAEDVDVR